MSRAQVSTTETAGTPAPTTTAAAQLRAEFWSLPDDALVDRPTAGAAFYLEAVTMEKLAIKGGGPVYMRINRRALYRKRDVLRWAAETGRTVENTAQLACHAQAASSKVPA